MMPKCLPPSHVSLLLYNERLFLVYIIPRTSDTTLLHACEHLSPQLTSLPVRISREKHYNFWTDFSILVQPPAGKTHWTIHEGTNSSWVQEHSDSCPEGPKDGESGRDGEF